MSIDWHALGTVFAVTLLSTVGLVGIFTLGILGMSRRGGGESAAPARGGAVALGRTGACLCFAACAAAVAYGISLIAG
ncbi:hypothetical protein [Actinacidiphila guanduensis]|jgi:hypothetical protein|uniref:Uncharacterized protein n=1 Tax=Actinacidiphila guanduensis TaxID=310781 RepID=A0A1H0E4Z0_9ACTN|nr:hypothetical protein [Actinacidiphila guanduensis]SDN77368.1 hypothetical protein SAMN05216259_105472 [Actinacidiphila guanduensis]